MKTVLLWLGICATACATHAQIINSRHTLPSTFSAELRQRFLKTALPNRFLIACQDATSFKSEYAIDSTIKIIAGYGNTLLVEMPVDRLPLIAVSDHNIRFVQSGDLIAREEAALSDYDLSLNHINQLQRDYPGASGNGMVVSVKENRPDTADIDLSPRFVITPDISATLSTHATTMSTLIAGAGNSFYTGRGVAKAAQIAPSSFAVLLPDADNWYKQNHVSVQNHSYGTGIENFYGADAAAYDASVIANPSLLHVFSAGNMGNQAAPSGNYANITGYANLTGSFKMSKNSLSVGATDAKGEIEILSSRGPAYDGRIKPELVAYGQDGSSGAAALVSGTACLLQEGYAAQHAGSLPDAALVKAILVATASSPPSNPVDFMHGYGALDACRAYRATIQQQFLTGAVSNGEATSFSIAIPAVAKNLRIAIAWTDPANTANAALALVNDLDLQLASTNTGQSWNPWILRTNASEDSLAAPARRGRDSINNIELITREGPAGGNYTIMITGERVSSRQTFYVAYCWDTSGTFSWTYPANTNRLPAASSQKLRWYSSDSGLASISYRYIAQNAWTAIAADTQITAGNGWIPWQVPDTNIAVQFRASIGAREFYSDTVIVSRNTQLNVGFACADSVLLYWNKQKEATAYRLSQLSRGYMQQALLTTDSFAIVPASAGAGKWWTVTPLFNRDAGLSAVGTDYSQQGIGCYISNFTADLYNGTAVIRGQLGSLFNVRSVVLEKAGNNGTFQQVKDFSQPLAQQISYTDAALTQGINAYRLRVLLQNGQTLYSSVESIAWLNGRSYLVFPNPVRRGQVLNLLSASLNNQVIQFYNVLGQPVYRTTLPNLANTISTNVFTAGVYYYAIFTGSSVQQRGKLVVQ
ncbi:MAG: S8 family peptidase [Bacteroidota bacterium]|nr:S8 family peptidase [Bacteroidota bacterium]